MADPQGRVTEIAPRWGDLVGKPREAAYDEGWVEVLHPADRLPVLELWKEAVSTNDGDKADIRYRIRLLDGSYRWFRARARPRLDDTGAVAAWYGSLEDIHEQALAEEALRASEERYRLASRATSDVIWDWSFTKERATWAGAYKKVLGYPELAGETDLDWWIDRLHPDDRDRVLSKQTAAYEAGDEYLSDEYRFLNAAGEWIDVRSRCVIVRDEKGEPVRLVGSMLDVTQQKKAEAELNWAAYHDPLTKLPNRALFAIRSSETIAAARAQGTSVALALLDLNGFKEINDSLGHPAGDQMLREVGQRLLKMAGPEVTVARLGGDEFAILVSDASTSVGYKNELEAITRAFDQPFETRGIRLPVSHCTGVAIWPRDAEGADELLIAADLALYAAKGELPGTMLEFSPSLKAEADQRSQMLLTARSALSENRIVAVYQPKVDLHTGLTDGWEALLRIRGTDGNLLPPAAIKAAFDDAELAVQLTDRMLSCVFADLSQWRAAGLDPGRIAVNLSAADFRHRDLASELHAQAGATGQNLSGIDIEVTETVLVGDLGPEVARMLERLRSLGVRVALDDFGTGYASLTHLQQFPVDVLKIDKSFVDRIRGDGSKETVVIDAVIQMARQLGLATVAEGVETELQESYLRARGCTQAQGYLFSPPVTADEVAKVMRLLTRTGRPPPRLRRSSEAEGEVTLYRLQADAHSNV